MEQLLNQIFLLSQCNSNLERQVQSYKKEIQIYEKHHEVFQNYDNVSSELQLRKRQNSEAFSSIKAMEQQLARLLTVENDCKDLKAQLQRCDLERQDTVNMLAICQDKNRVLEVKIREFEVQLAQETKEKQILDRKLKQSTASFENQIKKKLTFIQQLEGQKQQLFKLQKTQKAQHELQMAKKNQQCCQKDQQLNMLRIQVENSGKLINEKVKQFQQKQDILIAQNKKLEQELEASNLNTSQNTLTKFLQEQTLSLKTRQSSQMSKIISDQEKYIAEQKKKNIEVTELLKDKQNEIDVLEDSNNLLKNKLIGVLSELEQVRKQLLSKNGSSSPDKFTSLKAIGNKTSRRTRTHTAYQPTTPKEFISKDYYFPSTPRSNLDKPVPRFQ